MPPKSVKSSSSSYKKGKVGTKILKHNPFKCPYMKKKGGKCTFSVGNSTKIKNHLYTAHGIKTKELGLFMCPYEDCSYSTTHSPNIKGHFSNKHPGKEYEKYKKSIKYTYNDPELPSVYDIIEKQEETSGYTTPVELNLSPLNDDLEMTPRTRDYIRQTTIKSPSSRSGEDFGNRKSSRRRSRSRTKRIRRSRTKRIRRSRTKSRRRSRTKRKKNNSKIRRKSKSKNKKYL